MEGQFLPYKCRPDHSNHMGILQQKTSTKDITLDTRPQDKCQNPLSQKTNKQKKNPDPCNCKYPSMTTAAVARPTQTSLTARACGALAAFLSTLAHAWRARALPSISAFANARASLTVVATLA